MEDGLQVQRASMVFVHEVHQKKLSDKIRSVRLILKTKVSDFAIKRSTAKRSNILFNFLLIFKSDTSKEFLRLFLFFLLL